MLYDRAVSALMEDAANDLTPPFTPRDLVDWFAQRYPLVRSSTVRAHVIGLTANDRNRHHYPWLAGKSPLFSRRHDGLLESFDPDRLVGDDVESGNGDDFGIDPDDATVAAAAEFYLEAHLEDFLLANWDHIDWGRALAIWEDVDGRNGRQYTTPIGRLDFLCVDTLSGALVVVELKKGLPSDRVVGQVARYVGWIRAVVAAEGQSVEAIIVAHDADEALRYAVSAIPGLSLLRYDVSFSLRAVEIPRK